MKFKVNYYLISFLFVLLGFTSCIREENYSNDPEGNFNQLWRIIDEQYCYLDYKNIDWYAIGEKYRQRLTDPMTNENLFEVMDSMLYQLKDGDRKSVV